MMPVLYSEEAEAEVGVAAIGFHPNAILLKASTDAEFMAVLKKVFSSGQVPAFINSLIARINEIRAETEVAAPEELKWDEEN